MIQRFITSSGLRVAAEPMTSIQTVGISLFVAVGSVDEQKRQEGISHLLEHLLFKGTRTKGSLQLAREIDRLGSTFNAGTGREFTVYHTRVPAKYLYRALRLLWGIVASPAFSIEELRRENQIIQEEIKESEDQEGDLIFKILFQEVWQGSPYSHSILGTPKALSKLSKKDLLDYYKRYYQSKNMILSIAGKIDLGRLSRFLEKNWKNSSCSRGKIRKRKRISLPFSKGIYYRSKEAEQVHFCLAFQSRSLFHKEYHTYIVLDTIFGGGSSSRLFHRIREKKGLAYSIYSWFHPVTVGGLFSIYASTARDEWRKTFRAVLSEIRLLKDKGVTKKELELAKKSLTASWLLGMESSLNRAFKLGKDILYYDRVIPMEESLAKVEAVSLDDLQKVISRFRFAQASLALVGDVDWQHETKTLQKEIRQWL